MRMGTTRTTMLALLAIVAIGCSNDDGPVDATSPGRIQGRVTTGSGQAVVGAAVSTVPSTQSKLTEADGAFSFADVPPGTYVVTVVKEGLNPASASVTVAAGKTVSADIVMSSGPANGLPTEPMNPTPSDGAVAQPTELTLRWSASDPDEDTLRYDILFGTSNPPTAVVSSNQLQKVHYIAQLDSNTTYYWQVIARDTRGGVTSSPVWRFRTEKSNENKAPFVPGNPSPGMGAVHRSSQVTLAWIGQDPELDALKYDVYFGTTDAPSLVASDITVNNLLRSNLAPNARYYWRVVARDNHGGETAGPLWEFTTGDIDANPGGGNLVAYYQLSGSAQDASGNGNHGSLHNVVPTTDRHGRSGEASLFQGQSWVAVPHRSSLVFANSDFSVSAWVRLDRAQSDYAGILSKCTPYAPEYGYQLVVRNGNAFGMQIGSRVQSGQSYFDLITQDGLGLGSWHHVAMTVSRSSRMVRLYVDGQLRAESEQDRLGLSMEQQEPLYIGRERQGVVWFQGGIDDVKIFTGALTGAQVRTLASE